ncbi:nuclear transport factor 2 family protein [Nocardia bhagyanarayanae]|uniref:Ketosteroid isomerase-like protein n=1 Tax=Nocardia bhagyanarayanae TaxID=1215925 RepID=A0A543FID5_9NOCA|nr:nuclear transport factor 2 family protein [Nocardia bhagyanarayanae]TQM33474.1 ketosteroid isomerase-like protein [Nocardia bhagyanarayanae]
MSRTVSSSDRRFARSRRAVMIASVVSACTAPSVACDATGDPAPEHLPTTSEQVRRVADNAMDRFDAGWRTGDWQPFFAVLTDEFSFRFPEDPARGVFTGAQGRQKIEEWALFHARSGNRVSGNRIRTDVAGTRVIYEYESHGTSPTTAGYRNREIILVEIHGDRISALHEYWGDARPTTPT